MGMKFMFGKLHCFFLGKHLGGALLLMLCKFVVM